MHSGHAAAIIEAQKSPGPCPGSFLSDKTQLSSVLRDYRATPVETIDQRGADGLHEGLEGERVADEQTGRIGEFTEVVVAVVGSAVFGLHEPAGSGDAEDVQ